MKFWRVLLASSLTLAAGATSVAQALAPVSYWGSQGNGPGQFDLLSPGGLAIASDGRVFVRDDNLHRIQVFTPVGIYLYQWGSDGLGAGQFHNGYQIAIAAGNRILAVDNRYVPPFRSRIEVFESDSTFVSEWQTDAGGSVASNSPVCVGVAPDGSVYIGDYQNANVTKYSTSGTPLLRWGGLGTGTGQFGWPTSIAVSAGGQVYVADPVNHRIQQFDVDGTFIRAWGQAGSSVTNGQGYFDGGPLAVAIDANGFVYCADVRSVQVFSPSGAFVDQWGGPLGSGLGQFHDPGAIAIGPDGLVYVLDSGNNRVQVFTRPVTPTATSTWGHLKALYR